MEFYFALPTEPGPGLKQCGIDIAGMAEQLRSSLRQDPQNLFNRRKVQESRMAQSSERFSATEACASEFPFLPTREAGNGAPDGVLFDPLERACNRGLKQGESTRRRFHRATQRRDPEFTRNQHGGVENARQHVDVFVAVQMGDPNSRPDDLLDLAPQFEDDFAEFDLSRENSFGQLPWISQKQAVGTEKRRDIRGASHRRSFGQIQMDAHAQSWLGQAHRDGQFEGRTVGHQSCAGNNPMEVAFEDGAIHAGSQAEIIRVDNQPFHFDAPVCEESFTLAF